MERHQLNQINLLYVSTCFGSNILQKPMLFFIYSIYGTLGCLLADLGHIRDVHILIGSHTDDNYHSSLIVWL